jgi:hypothetical protein
MISSGTNARVIVYNTVVNWLAPKVNLAPAQIKVGRKFAGPPPADTGRPKAPSSACAMRSARRCRTVPGAR